MAMFGIVGIVITIVIVVISLGGVFAVLGGLQRGERERQRLLASGARAHARIVNVQMGSMSVTTGAHRQLQVQIAVEVHPAGAAPYGGMITTLVSELQIPQVQPGVWIAVRIDPANPANMAIEAFGVAAPGSAGPAGSPVLAPPMVGAMGGAPLGGVPVGVAPMGGFRLPLGAKIGLAVGVLGGVIGIGAAIMSTVWTTGLTGPSDVCKRAASCCRKMAGKNASASNCDNYLSQSGPIADTVCQESLKGFQRGGTCK